MAGVIIHFYRASITPQVQPYPNLIPDLSLHLCGSAPGHAIPEQAGIS